MSKNSKGRRHHRLSQVRQASGSTSAANGERSSNSGTRPRVPALQVLSRHKKTPPIDARPRNSDLAEVKLDSKLLSYQAQEILEPALSEGNRTMLDDGCFRYTDVASPTSTRVSTFNWHDAELSIASAEGTLDKDFALVSKSLESRGAFSCYLDVEEEDDPCGTMRFIFG